MLATIVFCIICTAVVGFIMLGFSIHPLVGVFFIFLVIGLSCRALD